VKPGQLQSFKDLRKEMVEYAKSEDGVLVYERYLSDDTKVRHRVRTVQRVRLATAVYVNRLSHEGNVGG
jgi:quinol monooxygenase YgiN